MISYKNKTVQMSVSKIYGKKKGYYQSHIAI